MENLDVEMAEQIVKLNEENKQLKEKLNINEKALYVAIKRIKYLEDTLRENTTIYVDKTDLDWFLRKGKEIFENECQWRNSSAMMKCKVIDVTIDGKSIPEISKEVSIDSLEQENKVLKKALELAVNCLQREIDGDYLMATEVQAIYEIGKDYFIDQAKESLK